MSLGLSIIIVHYNDIQMSQACVNSIKQQLDCSMELFIVDNSLDYSAKRIKLDGIDNFTVISESINRGFGGACNQAIRQSRGEYVLVLNNDVELHKDFIEELRKSISIDDKIGMYAPKIFLASKEGRLDSAGMQIYWDGLAKQRGHLENAEEKFNAPQEVLCPSGCAALYKREMLDEIGLFDEDFFLYCEDTDLGLRAQLAGWKCLYVPRAMVYHKYSSSSEPYSALKAFYVERNRVFVVIKNYNFLLLLLSVIFTFQRWLFQLLSVIRRQGMAGKFVQRFSFLQLLFIMMKAYLSALWYLPIMLQKRWGNKTKKISNGELYALLKMNIIPLKELAFRG